MVSSNDLTCLEATVRRIMEACLLTYVTKSLGVSHTPNIMEARSGTLTDISSYSFWTHYVGRSSVLAPHPPICDVCLSLWVLTPHSYFHGLSLKGI